MLFAILRIPLLKIQSHYVEHHSATLAAELRARVIGYLAWARRLHTLIIIDDATSFDLEKLSSTSLVKSCRLSIRILDCYGLHLGRAWWKSSTAYRQQTRKAKRKAPHYLVFFSHLFSGEYAEELRTQNASSNFLFPVLCQQSMNDIT